MLFKFWAFIALCLLGLPLARGGTWPDKPITIIVPFPAGGSIDAVMRLVSAPLAERLGQAVLIENVGGAGGAIGATRAANAPADGLTLLAGGNNDLVLQPLLNPALRYSTQDFEPISLAFTSTLMLVGRQGLPQSDIDEVVEAARAVPDRLSFGSPGVGTFQHMAMETIQRRTGTRMLHVPYKGAGAMLGDLLGGQIDMAVMAPPTALPYLQQGRLKPLGVMSTKRLGAYPNLATINESSSVKDLEFHGWVGIFVPRGVPRPQQESIRSAFTAVMENADVRKQILDMGMEPASVFDGDTLARRIVVDRALMGDLVRGLSRGGSGQLRQ